MYQQLWEYKVEEKLYLGVREQKRLNTTALEQTICSLNFSYCDLKQCSFMKTGYLTGMASACKVKVSVTEYQINVRSAKINL
jgi:hypothetical protein